MKRTLTAVLSAALALTAGADVQILPAGEFKGRTGQPGDGKTWKLDDKLGRQLEAKLNARYAGDHAEFHFDYDHQTFRSVHNGQKAPAAGWSKTFQWRPGQGLYALNVRWTPSAQGEIAAQEFRYVSPVILFDKESGAVEDVLMAALTNYPELTGMNDVSSHLATLNAQLHFNQEPQVTLLEQLLAKLGLPAGTTEAAALSAVEANKAAAARAPIPAAVATALGVATDATEAVALSAITSIRTKPTVLPAAVATALGVATDATEAVALNAITALKATDGGSTQVIRDLQTQVAALSAAGIERQVKDIVDAAVKDGKLLPAQVEWATNMGKKELAQLTAYIATAPSVAKGLGQQQAGAGGGGASGDKDGLSDTDMAVCNALGLDPKDYKAQAPAAA